jgi:DNA-binding SARP family transcriptional activator
MTVRLELLGPPRILRDDVVIDIPRRRTRAVLWRLAAPGGRVARDQLLAYFWPDLERPMALQQLRSVLHTLRRALGPLILSDELSLGLAPDVVVDWRTLDRLLVARAPDPGALASCLGAVHGELLAGVTLAAAPQFEAWLTLEREHCAGQIQRGMVILAQHAASDGHVDQALAWLERAIAHDPSREDIVRTAMQIAHQSGERASAIHLFERLRDTLDEMLGVPPSTATRALYDAIVTDRPLPAESLPRGAEAARRTSTRAPAPRFVGRTAEVAQVRAALGNASIVLISGPPGIGKTRLADEAVREPFAVTMRSTAREGDRTLPYQPLVEALRALLQDHTNAVRLERELAPAWHHELARLLPELIPARPPHADERADELRLREALTQACRVIGAGRPLAWVLDDAQWADHATLGFIAALLRRNESVLTVIMTVAVVLWPAPLAEVLHAARRRERLTTLTLEPLPAAIAHRMLTEHLPDAPATSLDRLARRAEGNPLILIALAGHARQHGLAAMLAEDGPAIPDAVDALVAARLERLSATARRVVEVAALLGTHVDGAWLAGATTLDEPLVLDALDELLAEGMIRPSGATGYSFDHALTAAVIQRRTSDLRRRSLHRRIATALEGLHTDLAPVAGMVMQHWRAAGELQRAARAARLVGQRAMRVAAWDVAIDAYRVVLAGANDAERATLLLDLGEAQIGAATYGAAAQTLEEAWQLAEAHADAVTAACAALAWGHALLGQSRFADAAAIAARLVARGGPGLARAEILWGAALSLEGADLTAAAAHFARAAAESDAHDASVRAQICFELGSVLAQQGHLAEAVAQYREAAAVVATDGTMHALMWRILAANNAGYHLHLLGDTTAHATAEAGLRLARDSGMIGLEPYLLSTLGEIALTAGDLAAAANWFEHGLALAERLAMPERVAGLTANLGRLALARGANDVAIHQLSLALAQADTLGTRHLATQIRSWLAPLLPAAEALAMLRAARTAAALAGRQRLLHAIDAALANIHRIG